jgi:hypothetical protein
MIIWAHEAEPHRHNHEVKDAYSEVYGESCPVPVKVHSRVFSRCGRIDHRNPSNPIISQIEKR